MTEVIYDAPQANNYPVGTIIKHPIYGYVQCEYNFLGNPDTLYWRNLARWERRRVKKYGTDTPVPVPESHAEPLKPEKPSLVHPMTADTFLEWDTMEDAWRNGYSFGWRNSQWDVPYDSTPRKQ